MKLTNLPYYIQLWWWWNVTIARNIKHPSLLPYAFAHIATRSAVAYALHTGVSILDIPVDSIRGMKL